MQGRKDVSRRPENEEQKEAFLDGGGGGKGRRSRGAGDRKMHTRLTTALHGRAEEL